MSREKIEMKRFSASLEPSSKNAKASPEKNQAAKGSIIKITQGNFSKQSAPGGESPHNNGGSSSECIKTISNEKKQASRRISIDTKTNNKILANSNQKGTSTATNFTSLHYHYVPYQQQKQNYQNFMKRTSNNTYINCSDTSNRSAPLHLNINYPIANNNKNSQKPQEVDDIMSLQFPISNVQGVAGNLSLSLSKVSNKDKNNQQVNVDQICGQEDVDKEDLEKSKRISLVVKRNPFHKSQKNASSKEQTSNDDNTSSISYFGTRMSTGQILQSTPSSKHTSNKFPSIETLKDNFGFSSSSSDIVGQGENTEKIEDSQQIGGFSRNSYLNLALNAAKQEGNIQSKECSLKYYGLGEHNYTNKGKVTPKQVKKETCSEQQDFNKSKTNSNYNLNNSPGSILHNEYLSKQLSEDCQGTARTDNTELNKAFVKGIMQKKQQYADLTKRQNNFVDANSNNLEDRVDYLQFVTPGCTTPLRNGSSVDQKNAGSLVKIQMEEVLSNSKEVQKQVQSKQNSSKTVLALSQGLLQQHQGFSSTFVQRSDTFLQDIEQNKLKQQGVNVRLTSQSQTQFPAAVTPKGKSKTDLKSSFVDIKDNLTSSRFHSQRTSQSFSLGIIPKDSKIQPVQGFHQFLDSQGVLSPPGSFRMPQASNSHMVTGKDMILQSNSPKSLRVSFFPRNSSMASSLQISHASAAHHNNPLLNSTKQFLTLTPPPSFVPPSHLIKQKSITPGRKDIGSSQEIHCAQSAAFRKIQPMKEAGIDILLKIKGKQKDNLLSKCDFNFAKHRLVSNQIQQTKVRLFKQNLI